MYQALPPELHVKDSPVAGQGLFAKVDIDAMMYLGISHVVVDDDIMRTPLGGFINHSEDPNCVKWYEEEDWGKIYHMKTIKPIKKGEELFLKYTFYSVKWVQNYYWKYTLQLRNHWDISIHLVAKCIT